MKRKLFAVVVAFLTVTVVSAQIEDTVDPSLIDYKEITATEYFKKAGSWNDPDLTDKTANLYTGIKGYKVTNVTIMGASEIIENGQTGKLIHIRAFSNDSREIRVYSNDFREEMKEKDPSWANRLDQVKNVSKYNGHYAVYLYLKNNKVVLYKIDGIPSQEQIDSDDDVQLVYRLLRMDKEAERIAAGYVYHGITEADKNKKLFVNGALEEGHAYYITAFVVKYGGSMAAIEYGSDFVFNSSQSSAVYVNYISQKVKGEIIEEGIMNFLGQTIAVPMTVVIAGGKDYLKTPVVLGIVKDNGE